MVNPNDYPGVIIEQPERITIGQNVKIKPGVVLRPENGFIHIGNNVVINHYTCIHGKGGVEIGDWTIIAPNCGIYAQNHKYDSFDKPITLQENYGIGINLMGDNWLGANSVVLDGVTLGKGVVVGAGAIVTKTFPMGMIIAGNPAKVIKKRFEGNWDFHKVERCSNEHTPEKFWGYINQRADYALKFIKPVDSILDVGCGEGYIACKIKPHCKEILGIDYSEDAVNKTNAEGIGAFVISCDKIDFNGERFDKVLCFEVLEHITRLQFDNTMKGIYRILKPGGMLIGSTPLHNTPTQPSTYSHIHEYTIDEFRNKLEEYFKDVTIEGGSYFRAIRK